MTGESRRFNSRRASSRSDNVDPRLEHVGIRRGAQGVLHYIVTTVPPLSPVQTSFRSKQSEAFSLVELLTVVAIISILSALTAPLLGSFFGASGLSQHTYGLVDSFSLARDHAMARNTYVWAELREVEKNGTGALSVIISESRDGSTSFDPANRTILNRTADLRGVALSDWRPAAADSAIDIKEGVIEFNPRGEVRVRGAAFGNQIRLALVESRDQAKPLPENYSLLSLASLTGRIAVTRP